MPQSKNGPTAIPPPKFALADLVRYGDHTRRVRGVMYGSVDGRNEYRYFVQSAATPATFPIGTGAWVDEGELALAEVAATAPSEGA